MKKEIDIRVEMTRLEGNIAALVKVDYMDKDAQEHSGLMMLDSGSNLNFLSKEIAASVGILSKQKGESSNIITITGEIITASMVPFSFVMDAIQFHDTFCVTDNQLPRKAGDCPIIGILGNEFMQRYSLAIDYSDFTLHTSHVSPENLAISDCGFFFP